MSFHLPPVVKLAQSLSAQIEQTVSRFQRAHRYTFGADLRREAWVVLSTADRAARKPRERAALLALLVDQVDDLKRRMALGQRLHLFNSFGQFEALMRAAHQLGKQVGGWHRQNHPNGQSGRSHGVDQSAMTLSTRVTSKCEVNG